VRVLLATDRPDLGHALSLFLSESQIDVLDVVDVVDDADTLLARVASAHPDVIVIDGHLGVIVSTLTVAGLKGRGDPTPVVILCTNHEDDPARTAGAAAYATLGDPPQSLLTVLGEVARATLCATRRLDRRARGLR
jgi:CheY-like chemotaxis protein